MWPLYLSFVHIPRETSLPLDGVGRHTIIGDTAGRAVGSTVGSAADSAAGSAVGSALGSAVGSVLCSGVGMSTCSNAGHVRRHYTED